MLATAALPRAYCPGPPSVGSYTIPLSPSQTTTRPLGGSSSKRTRPGHSTASRPRELHVRG